VARLRFRDRFYTPQVARAVTSPLGIVVAGAGVAVGIVAGFPIAAAIGLGAAAYGVRVAAAIPRDDVVDGIDPFSLDDPWRTFVWQARKAQRDFADAVEHTQDGPLKDRLGEIQDRITTGVQECWRVAQSGQRLSAARARIDIGTITRDLSALPTGQPLQANPALLETARALQAQLDTAKRMDEVIGSTRDRLRLLDARLGELVTRVLEISARPQNLDQLTAIGADVDTVVGEMESLRQALDESDTAGADRGVPTSNPELGTADPPPAPPPAVAPPPAPAPDAAPQTWPPSGSNPPPGPAGRA
jgi:hypothetical protein